MGKKIKESKKVFKNHCHMCVCSLFQVMKHIATSLKMAVLFHKFCDLSEIQFL